ncbi:type II toxin-antitoxin system VapC family toxin [Nitrospira moscoviensis]|uniref:PIN domain-containing protein n=1 Tax=Nitrospira moscoviensis TaxID=42253 RepID=A0A0K2GFK7_NITMO|nr:PIN domain-containing protein [Nitrospira moscoviensis]ALA59745.1 hypothetical protein NITMOv2_3353 [Nitrospira moscoviensis]
MPVLIRKIPTTHERELLWRNRPLSAPRCTTWDIVSETVTLLRYRRNYQAALAFLTEVKPGLHLVTYGDRAREEAEQIFRSYARDHRLSFCDALSFVVVTTLLDHAPCFTFDEDFRGLGLTVLS